MRGAGNRLCAMAPLGQGFLTGKVAPGTTFESTGIRGRFPRFNAEAMQANQAIVDLLTSIAASKQESPAQIALARLLARKLWIVPVPGTRELHRLEESLGSSEIELTKGDLQQIDERSSQIEIQGARGNGQEAYG